MDEKRRITMEAKKVSFAAAEDLEIEYYAGISWKESVSNVEEMRRMIWNEEYKLGRVRSISIAKLNDDSDEFK
ncbi:MAG: hypothetical protein ABIN01_16630 [Ferruginibacter sp.]